MQCWLAADVGSKHSLRGQYDLTTFTPGEHARTLSAYFSVPPISSVGGRSVFGTVAEVCRDSGHLSLYDHFSSARVNAIQATAITINAVKSAATPRNTFSRPSATREGVQR
jgi:hypothetical protein